ncbi:MAG: hypothetical protein P8R45_11485, partial [Candidatus Binatia bacterium]|nr:hypothetical protein [Candidatus Binatia bacterium]
MTPTGRVSPREAWLFPWVLPRRGALRELHALAELTKHRGMGDAEVRWVAIEEPLEGSGFPTLFDQKQMRRLSDLGRRAGA